MQPTANEHTAEYQRHVRTFLQNLPLWHAGGQEVRLREMSYLPAAIGSLVMVPSGWRQSRAWDFIDVDEQFDDPQPHLLLGAAEVAEPQHPAAARVGMLLVHLQATRGTAPLSFEHCVVPHHEWRALQLLQQMGCAQATDDAPYTQRGYYEPRALRIRRPEASLQTYPDADLVQHVTRDGLHTMAGVTVDALTVDVGHWFRIPKYILRLARAFDCLESGMSTRNHLVVLQNRYRNPAWVPPI